jgi:hypothetical protein
LHFDLVMPVLYAYKKFEITVIMKQHGHVIWRCIINPNMMDFPTHVNCVIVKLSMKKISRTQGTQKIHGRPTRIYSGAFSSIPGALLKHGVFLFYNHTSSIYTLHSCVSFFVQLPLLTFVYRIFTLINDSIKFWYYVLL